VQRETGPGVGIYLGMRTLILCASLGFVACSDASNQSGVDGGGIQDLASAGVTDAGLSLVDGGQPSGWLYTSGNKIYVRGGSTTTPWMGRGVNVDDLFLCGNNYMLQRTTAETDFTSMVSGLMTNWKPTFVRLSLGMDSYPTKVSWTANPGQYKTPMTNIINAIGAHPNVYVLVTLRSHPSMILQFTPSPEPTGIPSDHSNTPNATTYPNGTDDMYVALVDTFATSGFVLFGLTNEPGGNMRTDAVISSAMSHAVGVIRAEEDRLGVPHHIVSVQGNGWSSSIGYYVSNPIPYDNVVYEVHGYPPTSASYTYSTLPVIIGEYGTLGNAAAFFSDLESKQIPNLAWDFEPYSDCAPDLIDVSKAPASLTPTPWGSTVKAYLNAH